jgi:hypothetical protein
MFASFKRPLVRKLSAIAPMARWLTISGDGCRLYAARNLPMPPAGSRRRAPERLDQMRLGKAIDSAIGVCALGCSAPSGPLDGSH